MKKFVVLFGLLAFVFALTGCGKSEEQKQQESQSPGAKAGQELAEQGKKADPDKHWDAPKMRPGKHW